MLNVGFTVGPNIGAEGGEPQLDGLVYTVIAAAHGPRGLTPY